MPAPLAIRLERPDQPEVVALLAQLDAYLAELYAPDDNHILGVQALLAPEVRFLVARREGVAVGTAAVRLMPGEAATGGTPYGEIKRMFVAPSQRGGGIGRQLLAALEDAMAGQGLRLAMLETGKDQVEAVAMYRRLGYAECGPFAGYPDNGLSLFMRKELA